MTLFGIVSVTAWGTERIAALKPGESVELAHYRLTFDGSSKRAGGNYQDTVGHFSVRRTGGDFIGALEPSRRMFPSRSMVTTEAALMTRGVSQLYLSIGDVTPQGAVPVRLYFKPQVLMIWLGALGHVRRRRAVAIRSALARWCAKAGKSERGSPGGGSGALTMLCVYQHRIRVAGLLLALTFPLLAAAPLRAVEANELADPALQARARNLSKDVLRCLVCQN